MTTETILQELATRVQFLETKVSDISTRLNLPLTPLPNKPIEFIIFVDGQEVWKGVDLREKLHEIFQKHPDSQVTLEWSSEPFTWI